MTETDETKSPPPEHEHPKEDRIVLHAIVVFLVCLIGYVLLYQGDAYLRTNKGPWSVTFSTDSNNVPTLVVSQPAYDINNVTLRFPGESVILTNGATNILFLDPKVQIPFGELRHHDLTYQPGVVTLLVFNHEIEFIRRGLFIDRREYQWPDLTTLALTPTNAPPPKHPERKRTKDLEQ